MTDEDKVRTAHAMWSQVLDIQSMVAALRRSGVRGMRRQGLSLAECAAILGMSASRVKQIEDGLERKPRKEDT